VVNVWNKLPSNVIEAETVITFKIGAFQAFKASAFSALHLQVEVKYVQVQSIDGTSFFVLLTVFFQLYFKFQATV